MNIKVHLHNLEIVREPINEKEINITKCYFEFDSEMEDYIKEAYFTLNGNTYKVLIQNNECDIPFEVLEQKGTVELGVVAFEVQDEVEIKRYNPTPVFFKTLLGSLKDAQNTEPITPTDKEQIEQQLQEISTQMDNINVEAEKVEHTTTITITRKDGTSYDVEVLDGEKGDKGDKGDAGAIKMLIVAELPSTGADDTIYLVPLETPDVQGNNYAEYVYINGQWELLGKIGVQVDLTDYIKNTDYPTTDGTKSGAIKVNTAFATTRDNSGNLYAQTKTYAQYTDGLNNMFIGKGTLENVITGKGLVSNTSYASDSVGGVFKTNSNYNTAISNGSLVASNRTYANYLNDSNYSFISTGTLKNVLTATIGDIGTILDNINGEVL